MSANPRNDAIYVTTGDPETVSDPPASIFAKGQVGKIWTGKQPFGLGAGGVEEFREKSYRYVLSDSGMSVAPYKGAVAWWIDRVLGKVTTDVSAAESRNAVAGVFQSSVVAGHYCFLQVRGPASVKITDAEALGAQTAGLAVIPSATDAKAETDAAGTAPTYSLMGWTTGSGSVGEALAVVELEIAETPVG